MSNILYSEILPVKNVITVGMAIKKNTSLLSPSLDSGAKRSCIRNAMHEKRTGPHKGDPSKTIILRVV